MARFKLMTVSLLVTALSYGSCQQDSKQIEFTVYGWKAAKPSERRWMAEDFLKKYDVKGLPFAQIKELLGEPSTETDPWHYKLDLKDSAWAKAANRNPDDYKDLELLVHFKGGRVSYSMLNYTFQPPEDLQFDSEKWLTGSPSLRMRMAVNLIQTEVLNGKTKQEVEQSLGRPGRRSENVEFYYDLGLRIMDHQYLLFVVGPDQKVIEAKIGES